MSFILDAIAKSEQERQQQEVPGVRALALPAADLQQSRRVLPYFIAAALLLNAALFVTWMQSGQTLFRSSAPTQIKDKDRDSEQAIVSIGTTPANSTISVEPPSKVITPEVVAKIDVNQSTNEPVAEHQSALPSKAGEAATGLESKPEMTQPEPAETTTEEDATGKQSVEPVQDSQDEVVIQRTISKLSELPGKVRKDLPTMEFSGHLYSTNPASSFVFVDEGRPVTRGQEIVNELFLYEITPTGVIVDFRGYLIEVGVLQNWTLN